VLKLDELDHGRVLGGEVVVFLLLGFGGFRFDDRGAVLAGESWHLFRVVWRVVCVCSCEPKRE